MAMNEPANLYANIARLRKGEAIKDLMTRAGITRSVYYGIFGNNILDARDTPHLT